MISGIYVDKARDITFQDVKIRKKEGILPYYREDISFNNIYVLNLIAANLRNGMQYLKSDHIRGSEEETIVLSQVEVNEKLELNLF